MTSTPGPLRLIRTDTADAVRITLQGDFDYPDAHALLDMVTAALAEPGRPLDVRVDFAGAATVDSSGLSVLLMTRRHTDTAGVQLHLDNRPQELERMLKVTGTLDHFTCNSQDNRLAFSTKQMRGGGVEDPRLADTAMPRNTT
ncbi:STAS domain-containing protein [Streptomyces sp. cmx-4-9]|uniref:STAS domain-containing protein n=1 Tax=Streptomyces sp. cmx-4-9 TaxID=2790941 RepID=UPI00397F577C